MKYLLTLTLASLLAIALVGCTTSQSSDEAPRIAKLDKKPHFIGGNATGISALPRAVVYKTRADYNNLVPVTLTADGRTLASYPAPSDVSPETSTPIQLGDGYLLDRRGVGVHTAFLDYTYEQYAALPTVPPVDTLMAHIRDRDPFTALYRLPLYTHEALRDLNAVNAYIADGFVGCEALK